jgi:hypothetical protein
MDEDRREELEIEAIFAQLRADVRSQPSLDRRDDDGSDQVVFRSRQQLDRLWAVSADRPFLSRPGGLGRAWGALSIPAKWVLRKLMRWYVEPVTTDQRTFNAAVMRALDEQAAWMRAEIARLERRQRSE